MPLVGLIILVLPLLVVLPVRATTYFVAASGSDANGGTDAAHPWATLAKINGTTFSAGDSVLFNRGDVWYGSSLTAPSSGSSGAPITFGAYGSGANPVIKGSNLLATGGYVLVTLNTYRNTLGTAPVAVWESGALLSIQTSPGNVESTAGSWYYDGTYLYLHASDGSDIASNGKTYTYVTATSPSYTTFDNAKNWLIFDSLDQAETYNTSSATLGGLYLQGSNNIVRNAALHDTYRHPLTIYTGATNDTVTNVTAYNSYGTAPIAIYGAGTTGNLVQNSTFYTDTSLPPGGWGVVVVHGGSSSNTIDDCVIYSTAAGAAGQGVLVFDTGTSVTISHSRIYGKFAEAVQSGAQGTGSTVTLFDNLIDISQANNIGIQLVGSTGAIVYSNTLYGPANTNAAISQASTSTGALVKNNIFWTGAYASVDTSSESGSTYDYNDYFSASGTPFSWGGVAYTFANWKVNSSQDAHSLNADPKLTNAPGGNFSLVAGSPAIDAGLNLGSTYQLAVTPSASWPGGVTLLNQNSVGAGWEIGAYLFLLSRGTALLRGCCD